MPGCLGSLGFFVDPNSITSSQGWACVQAEAEDLKGTRRECISSAVAENVLEQKTLAREAIGHKKHGAGGIREN